MAVPIFDSSPSYLKGAGGIRQGSNIPLNLPSSLVRPTSAATRAVDQTRIRRENEERLKGISDAYNYVTRRGNLMFDDAGVVMQDAYDNASVAIPQASADLGNFAGDVAYNVNRDMVPIFQLGRDIKSGVGSAFDTAVDAAAPYVDTAGVALGNADISNYVSNIFKARAPSYVVGGSQGMQDTQEMGMARDAAAIQQDIDSDGLVYQSRDSIVKSLQAGDITADEGRRKLSVVEERQSILDKAVQNQGQRSTRFDKDRKELLESLGEDTTIKRGVSPSGTTEDALAAAKLIENAKVTNPSDPSNAAKTIAGVKGTGTAALKGTAEEDTNWFDALNSRVDLMAMGAAMLAGSGSGMGTASNFGQALQTGLGARASQAKAAENKKYKDAALLLDSMRARAALQAASGTNNIYKNYGAKIDDLGAAVVGLGVPQDESKAVASTIFSSYGNVMDMEPNARNTFLEDIIDRSTSWYDIGKKDVKLKDIRPAIVDITAGNI
tara:strand:- start:333 stop:1817 length:1485 start_codon:yes stop_codon:yes gene_type:complete